MIEDKYLELIHGEIDRANSAEESAKLRAFLAAHAEARQFYEELTGMTAMLQEVKPVEPPPHLPQVIMNLLPMRPSSAREKRNFITAARTWLAATFRPGYAFAFAGGAVAGVILLVLFSQPVLKDEVTDWSKLYGTMGAPQTGENASGEKRLEISQPEVTGTISLKPAGESMIIEIVLDSPQSLELVISFDEKALGFKSLIEFEKVAPIEMVLNVGSIRFTHSSRQSYALVFARRAATTPAIDFKVLQNSALLYQNTLEDR